MNARKLAAIVLLSATVCITLGDETKSRESVAVNTVGDMLEWQFGMTFALAERLENTADAKDAVNAYAFRYFLICHGSKAILQPNPEIDSALEHQRKLRLTDNQIKADPLDFGGSITSANIQLFEKSGGRAYDISTFEEYNELVGEFHLWLRSLGQQREKQGGAAKSSQ